jgi:hypothetical protein
VRVAVGAIALAFAPFTGAVVAQDSQAPYIEPEKRFARLVRIVPPDYPPSMATQERVAVVDVEGIIRPATGELTSPKAHSSSPADGPFIGAVSEVLSYWRFEPTFGRDCQPSQEPALVRVHFELDAGKPRVFVTHAKDSRQAQWHENLKSADYKTVKRVEPAYPVAMARQRISSNVYAWLAIDPSGSVKEIRARAYLNTPSFDRKAPSERQEAEVRRLERVARVFQEVVENALKQWAYVPIEGSAMRYACYDILFRLKD